MVVYTPYRSDLIMRDCALSIEARLTNIHENNRPSRNYEATVLMEREY